MPARAHVGLHYVQHVVRPHIIRLLLYQARLTLSLCLNAGPALLDFAKFSPSGILGPMLFLFEQFLATLENSESCVRI